MGGKPPTPINNIYILYDITADDKSNKPVFLYGYQINHPLY